jgi:hypothetical protein
LKQLTMGTYTPGKPIPSSAARLTNQLNYIEDDAGGNYTQDIKNQSANNYTYDAIGNLTKDVQNNITSITWTVYGKIQTITKTDNTTRNHWK